MKTVAIITNIPAPYRVDLYNYMQKKYCEYDIHILYGGIPESQGRKWTIEKEKMKKVHFYTIKEIKKIGSLDDRYIQVYSNINKELKKIKPEVVISFEYNLSALQSLLWCKVNGIKYINLTDGTIYSERNIGKIQKMLRRFIIHFSDAFIASSTKAKEKLVYWGAKESKIFVALLTNDISKFSLRVNEKKKNRILYVGSFVKRKGLDLLFEALELVKSDFSLHIVGSGSEEQIEELKLEAQKKSISSRVEWVGFKEGNDLVKEYNEASLFVLPTREDCFGMVLVEALAAGIPIVASKYADGAYDVIEENRNGFIIDPNDKYYFARTIESVLEDEKLLHNAQNINLSKFSFEEVSKQYIFAIEGVLNENRNNQ